MTEFDADKEAKGLTEMLKVAESDIQYEGGSMVTAKILDEVHKELCKLSDSDRLATLNVLSKGDASKGEAQAAVITDGRGTAIGFSAQTGGPAQVRKKWGSLFIPLACPD
jgi:hypothetical protein